MTTTDLKIGAINGTALALSFSGIETALKITLLCASIFYTLLKTYDLIKNRKNANNSANKE